MDDRPTLNALDVAMRTTLRTAKHFPFFMVVADELNMHRAAERLNISQSALSRRMSELEEALGGTALFERKPRGLALTRAGAVFAADVGMIVQTIDESARRASRVGRGEEGRLSIGFSEAMIRSALFPLLLRRFREARPEVEIRVTPLVSQEQRQRIRAGRLEIGFVVEEPGDAAEFSVKRLTENRLMLVLPRDHALAKTKAIAVDDLRRQPLIFPSRESSPRLYGRILDAFGAAGVAPNIAMEAQNADLARGFVMAGMGVAILAIGAHDPQSQDLAIRAVRGVDISLPISLIWLRSSSNAAVIDRFVDVTDDVLKRGTGQ